MRKKNLQEAVEDVSFGVLSTAINLTISLVTFGAVAFGSGTTNPRAVSEAAETATNLSGVSKESLKRAFWQARNRGLLKRERKRGEEYWVATKLGRKRLAAKIPIYQTKRPWDRKLYLITYDIPEEKHHDRTRLRKLLETLGAGQFQYSVYLMLWDPTEILKKFIKDHSLTGSVIVSDTGTDGSIGDIDLDELAWEVFKLEELNARYEKFLQEVKNKTFHPLKLIFRYFSILKDDPQLPFELLGPTWLGDKAYHEFQKLTRSSRVNPF